MPFNGSGVFSRLYSWVTDAANGVLVRSDRMDADTNDIADALTNCVTRDGQSPWTANLPAGGYKITGLGNGSLATDSVTYSQVFTSGTFTTPTLDAAVAKGTWTASGTWTLPAFTLGGTVTLNGKTLSGAATFDAAVSGITDLTTTGNTTLGNASTDTLNVGNGGIIKDASGNVGIGVSPTSKLQVRGSGSDERIILDSGGGTDTIALISTGSAGYLSSEGTGDIILRASASTNHVIITTDGRVYGAALHNNAGAVTGTTNQYIASGTYTPSLTNTTNVAASTAAVCQWIRVGNVVSVSGTVSIDATAAGIMVMGMSLPIASNLTAASQCGGTACAEGTSTFDTGYIVGDTTNDRATFNCYATVTANNTWSFHFQYLVA